MVRMREYRWLVFSLPTVALLFLAFGSIAGAQGYDARKRGQNLQPAYEGWSKNADGSFTLYFGYLNRNYEEELDIPIGANNAFAPGPVDQGQPTHFYARRQFLVFGVQVPADFGKQELVWTVTHAGRTDRAIAFIAPFNGIDVAVRRTMRGSGTGATEDLARNQPPSISAVGSSTLTSRVGQDLTLKVKVEDDGIPGPSKLPGVIVDGDGNARPAELTVDGRDTRPNAIRQDKVNIFSSGRTGLAVTWLLYRGPKAGAVVFSPMSVPVDKMGGKAGTTARFSVPGSYVIRAVADDQIFTTPVNVTVDVVGGSTP